MFKFLLGLTLLVGPSYAAVNRTRFQAAAVNDPSTTARLTENTVGSAALRAQIMLDRSGFSVGEIDGRIGKNTLRAVAGLQALHGLTSSNVIDGPTWEILNATGEPALVPYSVTEDDLKGPFTKVPADMMAKAKLESLGYENLLEELGEKFHCNPTLLRLLNPRARFDKVGEDLIVPNIRTPLEAVASRVVVSKSASTVTVFDASGKLIAQYPCTSGSEHDPLPIGAWKVTGVFKNPKFFYDPNLFWDASPDTAKARIAPGPNNPVGLVWIGISKEHYGIHGSPEPSSIGHTESHGCIRLTNWDAVELAGMVKRNVPVSLEE